MPIPQPFYINGPSLASATAVFFDAALTLCADDGFYSDGSIVREQVSCVLLPENTCASCCADLCSGWLITPPSKGCVTVTYTMCNTTTPTTTSITVCDPETEAICVLFGTTPTIDSGSGGALTQTLTCGCCTTECATWRVYYTGGLGGSVDVAWIDCINGFTSTSFSSDHLICIVQGTTPTVEGGSGYLGFYSCDCEE